MIIDLKKFIITERRYWSELELILDKMERDPDHRTSLEEIKRFHYLYQRASADLGKIMTFSSEPDIRRYLESLVARAYGEIHETRKKPHRLAPVKWFFNTFPQTFRMHLQAFSLVLIITLAGCLLGGMAIGLDPDSREDLMPFPNLMIDPAERVAQEESGDNDKMRGGKASFSSYLMTHNTKVSILAMTLGMTWGIGTAVLLFTNGVMLGAVAIDYIAAGQSTFLAGWLLPHGVVEIPAILLAGQAGMILAGAIIGWGKPVPLKTRLREVSADLVTLMTGVAIMLVWAGFIEAFFYKRYNFIFILHFDINFFHNLMILNC